MHRCAPTGGEEHEEIKSFRRSIIVVVNVIAAYVYLYRVSIKSFPDYKHLSQENYVEYKHIFFFTIKFVSKILCHVFIVTFGFWVQHLFLGATFPHRWIGRDGPTPWPPRSPDITPS